ncbi:TnsA-like heteromeric transposase endonuclease subunit [Promicromonospora sp. NPDC023987]|uniref:TnsA-like heteromeric transposase endonuclease subunit n=1 Tax=Promicromonospora sp. NPDC023987 TaxID=3155360 RepID=UPI0033DDEE26
MGAGSSVSFRDGSGRESTTDLGTVAASVLAVAAPWRVFRWRHGQAHYSGWYWSATTGGHVVYESRLELARLLLADFDPRVVAIAAQPFCVSAQVEGVRRRHVPDFLLLDAGGVVTIVNVKPADQLARPKVAAALAWAGEVFAGRGWRHEVWSEASASVLANVRFLAAYRYPDRVDTATVSWLEERAGTDMSLGGLEGSSGLAAGDVRAAALHLVWRGVFRVDLEAPLSGATVLERAA